MKRSLIVICLVLAACAEESGNGGGVCAYGATRDCQGVDALGTSCSGTQACLTDSSAYGDCLCNAGSETDPPASSPAVTGGTPSGVMGPAGNEMTDDGSPTDDVTDPSPGTDDGSTNPPGQSGTPDDGPVTNGPTTDDTPTDGSPPDDGAPDDPTTEDMPTDDGGVDGGETDDAGVTEPPEPDPDMVPVVVFLLDQSSSMFSPDTGFGSSEPFGTAPDNWEGVRTALAALEAVVTTVEVGLFTYTGIIDGTCPFTQQIIEPGIGSPLSITYTLPNSSGAAPPFEGQTPTGESLQVVIDALTSTELPGPKHIIILTDGDPDTCLHPNPQCGQDYTVSVAQAAWDNGITVHAVGLTDAVQQPFLESLAYAGQGLPIPPPLSPEQQDCLARQAGSMGLTFDPNDWRASALAEYADDSATFGEAMAYTATDVTQLTDILLGLMGDIAGATN